MANYPLINGIRFEWSSAIIKVDGGAEFGGIKEMEYSAALEPSYCYGNRAMPVGRTRGQYKPEAKMSMYKTEAEQLFAYLATRGGVARGFMEVPFDVLVAYAEVDAAPITDLIIGARIKKHSDKGSEGADALVTELELSVMRIRPNLRNPVGVSQL